MNDCVMDIKRVIDSWKELNFIPQAVVNSLLYRLTTEVNLDPFIKLSIESLLRLYVDEAVERLLKK